MSSNSHRRLEGLRAAVSELGADGVLITNIHNVSYLTGFTGSSGFVVAGRDRAAFITDFRYKEQSAAEVRGYDIVIQKGRWTEEVGSLAADMGIRKLAFEAMDMSFNLHSALSGKLSELELVPSKGVVETLRMVKDDDEIKRITEAVRRAEDGFRENASRFVAGLSETEAALGLEVNIRSRGARKVPFDIIVASGYRAALPHGIASDKVMADGDTLVVDFGGEADGYQSDLTRSGVLGKPDSKQVEIYDIVAEAQRLAIDTVRPGVSCKEVDLAARDYIASKGYGEFFGHGLGHGVGLEVHEGPSVSHLSEDVVKEDMVFTIEPGIYLPGWGGFRIEDVVLVTSGGCKALSTLEKDIRF